MSTRCPLCRKRFPPPFLPLHAASCTPPAQKGIVKRRRSEKPQKLPTSTSPRLPPSKLRPAALPLLRPVRPASTPNHPSGLELYPATFAPPEQAALLRAAETAPPSWTDYRTRLSKNYGPAYSLYHRRFLFGPSSPTQKPLPAYATETVLPRLRALTRLLEKFTPNQLAVGRYMVPGGYILPHRDVENGVIHTAVVGVCLGGKCTMTFIRRGTGRGGERKVDVVLRPGDVYVMAGDALRVWEHAIFPGRTEGTRTSLTLRDVGPHPEGWPASSRVDGDADGRTDGRYKKTKLGANRKP